MRGAGRAKITFRITVQDAAGATTLLLEGRVVGPWVDVLDQTWRDLISSLGSKRFLVDLRGVTHVDRDGKKVLADIHKSTGAQFLADTPMTKYFAAEARGEKHDAKTEEA